MYIHTAWCLLWTGPYRISYQVSFISYLEKNKKYIQQYTMKSIRGRYLPQTTLSMLTEKFRSRLIVYGKNALR